MKPLANEKTCSNSAIGLEIESATCVGYASKSRGKAKPQVESHTAKRAGAACEGEAPRLKRREDGRSSDSRFCVFAAEAD